MSGLLCYRVAVVLLIGALAAAGDACAQTTWYVDDDAGGGDGSAADPFDTIQEGINAAASGDTVMVLDGTYTGVGNRDLDFGGRLITVRSANGAASCVIDCQGLGRGFTFHSGETGVAVVEGFTITNGSALMGGGMYNVSGSSPTVTHCTFSGNEAEEYGGGMYNSSSSPMVTHCTFSDNTTVIFYGGGMYNSASSPTVTQCMFSQNAGEYGGGMYNRVGSSPKVSQCTFSGNTGTLGGGMYNSASSPTVSQCTFSGNTGTPCGGGMYNVSGSSPMVTQCTFSGNTGTFGGGMYSEQDSNPAVTNCIFWNDTPDEICNYLGSSPLVTYSDVQGGYAGTGNINADPMFADAGSGDYHLTLGSPCINAGHSAAAVVVADTTTDAGTQTSVIVANPSCYAIDDEIEYDGDGVLRTVTGVDPNSGQVTFDDPLAGASDPNVPVNNYGWGDMDGDDRIVGWTVDMGADEFVPPPAQLVFTEPPADGTLPKTQNNIIVCVFDSAVGLPPVGSPLVIVECADSNDDVSGAFLYSTDPNDTGDPTGATLKAIEDATSLVDQTWYHVSSAPTWGDVVPFAFDVCTLRGDANNSARVTTADYSEVKAHMGEWTEARYDLNGSGRITTADYSVVKANLGHRAPAKS